MNFIQKLLGAFGMGKPDQEKETPKAEPRFRDLENPVTTRRTREAQSSASRTERPARSSPSPTRENPRSTTQDDFYTNPATNPALWPLLYGDHNSKAKADDTPAPSDHSSHRHTSDDFSKATDIPPHSPAPSHSDHSSHSSYDSGSSHSSSSYDSGSSSSSFDSGGGGGGGGDGGASFAPEWR